MTITMHDPIPTRLVAERLQQLQDEERARVLRSNKRLRELGRDKEQTKPREVEFTPSLHMAVDRLDAVDPDWSNAVRVDKLCVGEEIDVTVTVSITIANTELVRTTVDGDERGVRVRRREAVATRRFPRDVDQSRALDALTNRAFLAAVRRHGFARYLNNEDLRELTKDAVALHTASASEDQEEILSLGLREANEWVTERDGKPATKPVDAPGQLSRISEWMAGRGHGKVAKLTTDTIEKVRAEALASVEERIGFATE